MEEYTSKTVAGPGFYAINDDGEIWHPTPLAVRLAKICGPLKVAQENNSPHITNLDGTPKWGRLLVVFGWGWRRVMGELLELRKQYPDDAEFERECLAVYKDALWLDDEHMGLIRQRQHKG